MTVVLKHKIGGTCEVEGCSRPHYGRGLCKAHHQRRWKRGLLREGNRVSLREKIELYAEPVPEAGCWIWTRHRNNKGYGRVSVGQGRREYAHRAAYAAFNGPIPSGMEVCHRCDTPACCNPDHLFLGDHWDNMADASRKGRIRNAPVYGVEHPGAVLTSEQVDAIRKSHRPATYWARVLGCNPQTVRRARSGQTYSTHQAFGDDEALLEKQRALNGYTTRKAA